MLREKEIIIWWLNCVEVMASQSTVQRATNHIVSFDLVEERALRVGEVMQEEKSLTVHEFAYEIEKEQLKSAWKLTIGVERKATVARRKI